MGDPACACAHVRDRLAPGGTMMLIEPFAHDDLAGNLNPVCAMDLSVPSTRQLCANPHRNRPGDPAAVRLAWVTSFAVVGAGWRAGFFWRLAASLPDLTCVGAVVRTPRDLPVPAFGSLAGCLRSARPDFVVTAVPWPATPAAITGAVACGVPVLAETPPAPDLAGLRALWAEVGGSGLVQVAEQYLLMPSHAARAALVRSGAIGTPTQVQVSSTHQYHAVSLMRGLLRAGRGAVTVRAVRTTAPLVDPLTRDGWTDDPEPKPATTTIATIDFGGGRSGVYDFTGNQWHNQLRFRRVLVRGTHGELRDDAVVRLVRPRTIVRYPLVLRQTGNDLEPDA